MKNILILFFLFLNLSIISVFAEEKYETIEGRIINSIEDFENYINSIDQLYEDILYDTVYHLRIYDRNGAIQPYDVAMNFSFAIQKTPNMKQNFIEILIGYKKDCNWALKNDAICIGSIEIKFPESKITKKNKFIIGLKKSPSTRIENYNKCIISFLTDTKEKSLRCFQNLAQKYPNFSYSYLGLGTWESLRGDMNKAIKYYLKALKLKPYTGTIYKEIAHAYFAINDYKQASFYYIKFITNHRDIILYYHLALACSNLMKSLYNSGDYLQILKFQDRCSYFAKKLSFREETRFLKEYKNWEIKAKEALSKTKTKK